jgi:hypothetical protein
MPRGLDKSFLCEVQCDESSCSKILGARRISAPPLKHRPRIGAAMANFGAFRREANW